MVFFKNKILILNVSINNISFKKNLNAIIFGVIIVNVYEHFSVGSNGFALRRMTLVSMMDTIYNGTFLHGVENAAHNFVDFGMRYCNVCI